MTSLSSSLQRLLLAQFVHKEGDSSFPLISKSLASHPLLRDEELKALSDKECEELFDHLLKTEGLVRQPSTGIGAEVEPSPSVIKLTEILHSRYRKQLIEQIRQDEYNYRQYLREIEEIGRGEWDGRLQDLETIANLELDEDEGYTDAEKQAGEEDREKQDADTEPKEIRTEAEVANVVDEATNLEDLEMKDIIEDLPPEDLVARPSGEVPTTTEPPQSELEPREIDSQATIENTQETGTTKSMIPSTNPPSESFFSEGATQESEPYILQAQNNDSTTVLPNDSTVSMVPDTTDEHPSSPVAITQDVSVPVLTEEDMRMDESGSLSMETDVAVVNTELPDSGAKEQGGNIDVEMGQSLPTDNAEAQPLATNVQSVGKTATVDIEEADRDDTERTISPDATEMSEGAASRAPSAEPLKANEDIDLVVEDATMAAKEKLEYPDLEGEVESEIVPVQAAAPDTGGELADKVTAVPEASPVDVITEPAAIQQEDGERGNEALEHGDLEATESPVEAAPEAYSKTDENIDEEVEEEPVQVTEEVEQVTQEPEPEIGQEPLHEPLAEPIRKGPGRPRKRGLRKVETAAGTEDHEENEKPDQSEAEKSDKVVNEDEVEQVEEMTAVKGEEPTEQERSLEEEEAEEHGEGDEDEEGEGVEEETAPRTLRGQRKRRYSTANVDSSPQTTEAKSSPAAPAGATPRPTNRKFQALVAPLLANISSNRSASFFTNPVNENDAPNYYNLIYEPTDLRTIKTMVKEGRIQSSSELEREIMKMFANAVMYNKWDSDIGEWSREMQKETETLIALFRGAERRGQNGNNATPIPEPKRRKK
ncbi:hypothetical protein V1509DRAFT_625164 [Lipomyces kononenkoae]